MNENKELRNKAIEMRTKNNMSLKDIVDALGVPKTTVYYWIKNYKLDKIYWKKNVLGASITNKLKYQKLRDCATEDAKILYEKYKNNSCFKDFICMFLTEGYRKTNSVVNICNSNPNIIILCNYWFKIFTNRKISYVVHVHTDDEIIDCVNYWAKCLNLNTQHIKVYVNKHESKGKLNRKAKLKYGTFHIITSDTYFLCKMKLWGDVLQNEWINLQTF
jgi:hypothetical protein